MYTVAQDWLIKLVVVKCCSIYDCASLICWPINLTVNRSISVCICLSWQSSVVILSGGCVVLSQSLHQSLAQLEEINWPLVYSTDSEYIYFTGMIHWKHPIVWLTVFIDCCTHWTPQYDQPHHRPFADHCPLSLKAMADTFFKKKIMLAYQSLVSSSTMVDILLVASCCRLLLFISGSLRSHVSLCGMWVCHRDRLHTVCDWADFSNTCWHAIAVILSDIAEVKVCALIYFAICFSTLKMPQPFFH